MPLTSAQSCCNIYNVRCILNNERLPMSLLIGNRLRKNLLAYSFAHPEESFYVRELSVLIDEDPGNLSRELKKLEEEGLYVSSKRGREKFYSLNKAYPLFGELKAIISKTEGVEGSLKEIVSGYKGISRALIHGSYVDKKEKAGSDIDLIVAGEFSRQKFTDDIRKLESKLNRQINFTSFNDREYESERNNEGSFLNIVLRGKTIKLKDKTDA